MKPEEALHRACVDLLRLYEQRGMLAFAHCPNGGYRTKAEACLFRAMGVRAGVPDLLVWAPGGAAFGIELKAAAGKLSAAQSVWHRLLQSLGHHVHICRSVDEVEAALRAEGIPTIGKLAGAA
jgi:hypothetical protein